MLHSLTTRWNNIKFKIKLFRAKIAAHNKSTEYLEYINTQFFRTHKKLQNPLQPHTKLLVDKTAEFVDLQKCDVLCIGCRNTAELDYFRQKGAKSVVGIDLISTRKDILVMDMHQMTFRDHQFDVVYSAHSLEHAFDLKKVVNEINRVLRPGGICVIEVPVRYKGVTFSTADIVDFESLDELHAAFLPHIGEVFFSEDRPASSIGNQQGTPIIRSIFQINKQTSNNTRPPSS